MRTFKLPSGRIVLKVPISLRQLSSNVASSGPYHLSHQRKLINMIGLRYIKSPPEYGVVAGKRSPCQTLMESFSSFSLRRRKLPLFLFMTWNVHQIRSSDSGVSTPGRPLSFQQTPSYSQLGMRLDEKRIPARPAGEHRDSKHVLTQQGTSPDMPVRAKKKRSHRRAALVPRHPSPPKTMLKRSTQGRIWPLRKKNVHLCKPHASTHTQHCVRGVQWSGGGAITGRVR